MNTHTLELLEFDKVRRILAGYAASALGKELAGQIDPSVDLNAINAEQNLVTEAVWALEMDQAPPLGGLRDVRMLARRAAIGSMLTAEQLLEVAATLGATGDIYRYRTRLSDRCQRLIAFLTPIEDLGMMGKAITSCVEFASSWRKSTSACKTRSSVCCAIRSYVASSASLMPR